MEACFEAGTLVATPDGLKPIEKIAVGNLVLSVDPETRKIAPKRVTRLIRPNPKPVYELALRDAGGRGETFHVTADHRWEVDGVGWVATAELKAGDRIETGSGVDVTVAAVLVTKIVERTFNLEVADWHTFMVGKDHAVVHNGCLTPSDIAAGLGYNLDKSRGRIHGQPVYRNGNRYISFDIDSHSGGYWKMFELRSGRLVRTGTWNMDLSERIGN